MEILNSPSNEKKKVLFDLLICIAFLAMNRPNQLTFQQVDEVKTNNQGSPVTKESIKIGLVKSFPGKSRSMKTMFFF